MAICRWSLKKQDVTKSACHQHFLSFNSLAYGVSTLQGGFAAVLMLHSRREVESCVSWWFILLVHHGGNLMEIKKLGN